MPCSQLALFAAYSYHGCITDRDWDTLELEADHRRHAEIENAIRDFKYSVGLNHLPSGCFAANGAWVAVQVMAHNLARRTTRIGLGEQLVTTKALRRRLFSLAGRLTHSARRLTLHLPQRWPREKEFSRALAGLRAIPLLARIHRRDAAVTVRRGTRSSEWICEALILIEMDGTECSRQAKGRLTARGSDTGSDFQRRPEAEGVRGQGNRI